MNRASKMKSIRLSNSVHRVALQAEERIGLLASHAGNGKWTLACVSERVWAVADAECELWSRAKWSDRRPSYPGLRHGTVHRTARGGAGVQGRPAGAWQCGIKQKRSIRLSQEKRTYF
ncbi:hypothetical protein J6590_054364 [Homalodisca vitripennis]|nr:hypothetical protein J6590_054364 [Homalodisca vitripennis]